MKIEEEILPKRHSDSSADSLLMPLLLALFIVLSAIFVGEMLFGKNSLKVYNELKKDKKILQNKISTLKKENAALQKKYFEYKNLLPSSSEEEE
jgi:cell division protein FtsB